MLGGRNPNFFRDIFTLRLSTNAIPAKQVHEKYPRPLRSDISASRTARSRDTSYWATVDCTKSRLQWISNSSNICVLLERPRMDVDQDDEVDVDQDDEVDIAAQMGFASFGSKPKHKKRKIEADVPPATSSNAIAVSDRSSQGQQAARKQPSTNEPQMQPTQSSSQLYEERTTATTQPAAEPDLRAYRHGVRNERGDMAYFLPSFIEDPWKDLDRA